MKHASGEWQGSLQALFENYVNNHVTVCTEPGPCRDEDLLGRAAHAVLLAPEPGGSCRLFLLYRCVLEQAVVTDLKHLSALVRATELLETLCLNLYLQPWRREIRSLKSFTGAFVYCLLPALSSSALQSVLAAIGYLPCEDSPSQSEYRLFEEASPDQAMKVGFELLLARALCLFLLQILQQDQRQAQEWVEALRSKVMSQWNEQTCREPKAEENEAEKEGSQSEEQQGAPAAQKECEDLLPKAQRFNSVDQSIVQMHMTYPDLVFRGRPLLQDRAHIGTSSAQYKAAQLSHRRAAHMVRAILPDHSSMIKENTGDEGQDGPTGLSLHITLRPHSLKPSVSRYSTQHQTGAGNNTQHQAGAANTTQHQTGAANTTQHQTGADISDEYKGNNELAVSCEAKEEPAKTEQLHVPHPSENKNKQTRSVKEFEEESAELTSPASCQRCNQDHLPAQAGDREELESL